MCDISSLAEALNHVRRLPFESTPPERGVPKRFRPFEIQVRIDRSIAPLHEAHHHDPARESAFVAEGTRGDHE